MRRFIVLVVALSVAAFAAPAVADSTDVSAFSLARVSIGAGVDHAWPTSTISGVPDPTSEWIGSLNGAYNTGKLGALVGSVQYRFDSEIVEYRLGLRVRLFRGGK